MSILFSIIFAAHFAGWLVASGIIFNNFLPDISAEKHRDKFFVGLVTITFTFVIAQLWFFLILGALIEKYEKPLSAELR